MKLRMLKSVLEPDTWTHREEGEVHDVPEAIARDYLLRGIAVPVAPPIEHAVIAPAETADRPAQRGPKARR
jgi:hypothetical protein